MSNLGDRIFTNYLKARSNQAMFDAKEEAAYFEGLTQLVRNSSTYNGSTIDGTEDGMTDWQFANSEMVEAIGLYCDGDPKNCYAEGADNQATMVGILNQALQKNKQIFDNTQIWVQQFTSEGGFLDKISKMQKSYDGQNGTKAAQEIAQDMADFRKKNDTTLSQANKNRLDQERQKLLNWITQATAMGRLDLDPTDEALNFMLQPEVMFEENPEAYPNLEDQLKYRMDYAQEAELTIAVQKLQLGDTDGARSHHDSYVRGIEKRWNAEQERIKKQKEALIAIEEGMMAKRDVKLEGYSDEYIENVAALKRLELDLEGRVGLDYDKRFADAIKYKMEDTAVTKDLFASKNKDQILKGHKDGFALNLASLMQYAEGAIEDRWNDEIKNIRADNKNLSNREVKIRAVNNFFGPKTELQMSNIVEGKTGWWEDWGMDFPGWGWFKPGTKEENSEEYMLQTFKAWKTLYNMENDPDLKAAAMINQTKSMTSAVDTHGFLNFIKNKKKPLIDVPDDYDPYKGSKVDSLINQMGPDTSGVSMIIDKKGGDQGSVINMAMEKGINENEIVSSKELIVEKLAADGELQPNAVWHMVYEDYLNSADIYESLTDYLNSVNEAPRMK